MPAVTARTIHDIQASNFASIELVVLHDPHAAARPQPRWRRKLNILLEKKRRSRILFSQYSKWDHSSAVFPSPDAPVDCATVLATVPTLHVTPLDHGPVHRFSDDDLRAIANHQLDVILRFGFNILRGGILDAARCGVWSYHHGDNDSYRGGPPLLWEIVEGNPESGVILQKLTDALDNGLVLRKSTFRTLPGVHWSHNEFGPFWGTQHFVIEQLWHVHNYGWEHVHGRAYVSSQYHGRR
ncbi:MAG: hypothetical protein ABL982_24525, partial [Vicinamibacterales bacterium]